MNSYSIYKANWVNATNLNASNTVYATIIRGATIYQGTNQVIDTITANAPISVSGSGNSRTIGLNYDTGSFTLSGSNLALSNTGVTAGTYGSASQVAQFTVDAQGRITSASNVSIAINASQITSGILPLVRGGTGADLSTAGNYIIVKSGSSLAASPVDLASANFTGVLPLSKGGTGASLTANAGGIVYSTSSALAISSVGSPGQVLVSGGTGAPSWTSSLSLSSLTMNGNINMNTNSIVGANWVNGTNAYFTGTIYGNLGTIKKAVIYKFTTNGSLYIPANSYVFALLIGGGGGGYGLYKGGDGASGGAGIAYIIVVTSDLGII
jgi:hypothetical protein